MARLLRKPLAGIVTIARRSPPDYPGGATIFRAQGALRAPILKLPELSGRVGVLLLALLFPQ
ncbi:hypothetical protein [Burkholderia sp. D-99]|uniref:hypothetical protein n=1 Tax=unclassified Burkholderia TaxID=2613784 RepID=UPI00141F4B96|nr:hypothetical protein [Burkholderia sp. D-99]MBZ5791495.1 hypothetical protein [Burkholderia contaminans]NHV29044.1 hypothetical protein [Burkholderia sp. D-99]